MTFGEKIETTIICMLGIGMLFVADYFPEEIGVGKLLLNASALLLFQSLVRDIWLLTRIKLTDKPVSQRKARCMCIESTVGASGVLIGVILLGLGIDRTLVIAGWQWIILMVAIPGVGFFIKDYVLEWNPWRLRRDKDHMNVIFSWKT